MIIRKQRLISTIIKHPLVGNCVRAGILLAGLQSCEQLASKVVPLAYEVKDGQLVFKRNFVQRAITVPVAQYDSVRNFFSRMRAAEQSPVVLAKS
jgi:hypothetical protein